MVGGGGNEGVKERNADVDLDSDGVRGGRI